MKKLITLFMITFTSLTVFAETDCNQLQSGDSVVLCKQNKRILRKLNSMNMGNTHLKSCTITYCGFYDSVNNYLDQIKLCTENTNPSIWRIRTMLIEARNKAHAFELFANLELPRTKLDKPLTDALISTECE